MLKSSTVLFATKLGVSFELAVNDFKRSSADLFLLAAKSICLPSVRLALCCSPRNNQSRNWRINLQIRPSPLVSRFLQVFLDQLAERSCCS